MQSNFKLGIKQHVIILEQHILHHQWPSDTNHREGKKHCLFYTSLSITITQKIILSTQTTSSYFLYVCDVFHQFAQNDGLFAFLTEPSWPPLLPAPLLQLVPSLLGAFLSIRCAWWLCFCGGGGRGLLPSVEVIWRFALKPYELAPASGRWSHCCWLQTQEDDSLKPWVSPSSPKPFPGKPNSS